jgi:very-short-patch-repair endonuclease
MRHSMTDAEQKLWNELLAHKLMKLSFRRQMPIAAYIVDFACPAKKLIVEVDGFQHGSGVDAVRDGKLSDLGWTILRFWNHEVLRDIDNVCRHFVIAAGLVAEDAEAQAICYDDTRRATANPREHHP